ncbi:MAG TPA: class I SAM-dependent methyltransferase [Polyangiaceae bacterium]|nr:class I SAM-dependent methyltransferase [Polyangiaceae bacterium]
MPRPLVTLKPRDLERITGETLAHYEGRAHAFWKATKDHDVTQNIEALLSELDDVAPLRILDIGCGPGRDLVAFKALGHEPVGLDGSAAFVKMARERSGCEVWQQNLLEMSLPDASFDGVFANAVLFHVPTQELPRVLGELFRALKPGGVLFASNPRGPDIEGQERDDRYGAYLTLETWRAYVTAAGFVELRHYFRPEGRPLSQQPWLATVWRRPAT